MMAYPFGGMSVLARLKIRKYAVEIEIQAGGVLLANRTYLVNDAISHYGENTSQKSLVVKECANESRNKLILIPPQIFGRFARTYLRRHTFRRLAI